jgi:hypothetical protein
VGFRLPSPSPAAEKQEQIAPARLARPGWHRTRLFWLGVLFVSSELAYIGLLYLNAVNGVRPVLTFLSLMGLLFVLYGIAFLVVRDRRSSQRRTLLLIAAGAVVFRLTLLPAGLPHGPQRGFLLDGLLADMRGEAVTYERFQLFDGDIWRYLWDGHVWAHGINPYRYPPDDEALDALADEDSTGLSDGRALWRDIRDNVNYPATPTIYPPLAQLVFRLSHWISPGSVLAMKAVLVGFDLLAAVFLVLALKALGRSASLVILYAWNPLVVKVFAGSGHVDAVLVAAVAATAYFLARRAHSAAAVAFGLAVTSKLSPLVLLPFVVRRIRLRNSLLACAVVLGAYVPFLGVGQDIFAGFLKFGREWQFNAGPFALVRWIASSLGVGPDLAARVVSGMAIVAIVCWLAWRDDQRSERFATHAAPVLGALILLSPTVMPWYVTWLLPLAILAGQWGWIYFSALVCFAFFVMIDGTEPGWTRWLEYGIFTSLLSFSQWRSNPLRRIKHESHQDWNSGAGVDFACAGTGARERIDRAQ